MDDSTGASSDEEATTAARYDRIAGRFGAIVDSVPADRWDAPTPCTGWVARDIIGHLTEWVPAFFGPADLIVGGGPEASADPRGAWAHLDQRLRAALADPAIAGREFDAGPPGSMSEEAAIAMVVIGDLFVHTWDLARAAGLDDTLDPTEVAAMLAGMEPMDEALRASGHFGPKVPVDADAGPQARLLAFMGRNPDWAAGEGPTSAASTPP